MSVSGQVLNAFTIEGLPDTQIEFQVVLESTVRVISLDGIERGQCKKNVICRPVKFEGASSVSGVIITDWTPYIREDNELVPKNREKNIELENPHHENGLESEQYSQLKIKCSLEGSYGEVHATEETIESDVNGQSLNVNEPKSWSLNTRLWKPVTIKFSVSDNFTDETISRDVCTSAEVQFKDSSDKKLLTDYKSTNCIFEELQSNAVDCEPVNTLVEEPSSRENRALKRNVSRQRNKAEPKIVKGRKRKTNSRDDTNAKKVKRKQSKEKVSSVETIKAELESNEYVNIKKSDENFMPDCIRDIKIEDTSCLNKNDSDVKSTSVSKNKKRKQGIPRKRQKVSKSLKVTLSKQIRNSKTVRQSKGLEDAEINTEGIDPKLIYAKKSLEKQNAINSKRIRVELEDYTDKFRSTVVESMAQKDRGKSFEEKSYQSYECLICGRFQSAVQEKIRFHIEQHVNGELECKKCGYILSYRKEISRHNNEAHTDDFVNKRVCELCGVTASSYRMWKAHMSKVHKMPSFKCKHCSEKFFNAAEVVVHTRETHKDITLTCDKCGQVFVGRSNWSYHSVRCNGTANSGSFVCDQCGKDLTTAIALKRHIRHSHEMEKTQKCTLCSYATYTIARLQKHMNAHLGNKQYRCEICQFSSVQKYQLTSHMRTHNGEKPFRCDQCPYSVAWNVQLKAHKKVHSLASAVSCKTCAVVFRDAKSLSKHEQKDHGIKSNSGRVTKSVNNPAGKTSVINGSVSNCIISSVSNGFNVGQAGLFTSTNRNVSNINEVLPNVNDMVNINSNIRNHLNQLENSQLQLSTQMPVYSFSYQ